LFEFINSFTFFRATLPSTFPTLLLCGKQEGSNPTIVNYNDIVVRIYNSKNNLVRFKTILCKNALSYFNASVVVNAVSVGFS
jgi:hypothetical protein